MRRLAILLLLVGCYQEHTFRDCELSCTDELGCPSGLSCLAGMCRESGASGACSTTGVDGMVDAAPDRDGDGVPDDLDNCPDMMNTDQANEDLDEFGDVCDICPISANNADADHDNVGDDCDPDSAMSDGAQSMFPGQFERLMAELRIIAPAIGRSICQEPVARRGWGQ